MKNCPKIIKKKRGIKRRVITALLVMAAIITAVSVFISKQINPMIITISNEKIKSLTVDAVNGAVIDVMSQNSNVEYISLVRDDNQAIKSVDVDAKTISDLAQKITIESQKRINAAGLDGVKIPMGSLSGITLLTGLGPDINIRIYLTGSTQTRITSEFSESGINQTLHRLYLDIHGEVAVAIPGLPSTIKTDTQVLMNETIIIGEVPPTYLRAVNIGDMMDLVVD